MTEQIEYRAYCFTNMYLSQIQRGIQSAHAIVEMHNKCTTRTVLRYQEWAENHKTMIVLNGGSCDSLVKLLDYEDILYDIRNDLPIPFGYFNEDSSLNNALTAVTMVLPQMIFKKVSDDELLLGGNVLNCIENRFMLMTGKIPVPDILDICVELNIIVNSCRLA